MTVPAGQICEIRGTLTSTGNVIVFGTLRMRTGSVLEFSGVDSSRFVGGGMSPVVSDVGLWVMGDGVLDAVGTPVKAWNRTGTDPTWNKTDELLVAPVKPGVYTFAPYSLGSPVPRFSKNVPAAEVINLSRDVTIRSVNGDMAHIFIHSTRPQTIKHISIEAMGPQRDDVDIMGRYALHFHHMADASRGSLVEGVVARNGDSHAFVAHGSHGITFRETIAYRTRGAAYWWDPRTKTMHPSNESNDIVYERAGAAEISPHGDGRGKLNRSWGAFELQAGTGGKVIDSWAAGTTGVVDAAGFAWPPNEEQNWLFTGNVAHNGSKNGIWTWQNASTMDHHIQNFTAYANDVGIDHGAYRNRYRYTAITLDGNTTTGLELHSYIGSETQAQWDNWKILGSPTSILVRSSATATRDFPVTFTNCHFTGPIVRKDNAPKDVRVVTPTSGC